MPKIGLIVDSAGSLPRNLLNKHYISEVAFRINFGETELQENVSICNMEFYQRLLNQPHIIPKTSTPSISEWLRAFEEKYKAGYLDFIVTTIAKPLSASIESATIAAHEFKTLFPKVNIHILESRTCGAGQAALEIKIAQLIEQGELTALDIVKKAQEILPHIISLFSVNELTYMRAGGRIGGATAFLGKLINIKPVCEFIDGVVHPIKPVRSRNKALCILVDEAINRIKNAEEAVICVQHAYCPEDASFLVNQLREKLNFQGIIYESNVGAVIGSHSGPSAIGIGICLENN
ncbi:MAG: DegV family protein [Syntrophomonadaceae bacterium]|nr:DegV family protein [Syntrophomonadaceae bacterium]